MVQKTRTGCGEATKGADVDNNTDSGTKLGNDATADGTKEQEIKAEETLDDKEGRTSDMGSLPSVVAGVEDDGRVKGASQLSMGWAEGSCKVNRPPVADTTMSAAKGAQEADGSVDRLESVKSQPGTEEVPLRAPNDFDVATSQSGNKLIEDTRQCLQRVEDGAEDIGACLVEERHREVAKRILTRFKNKGAAGGFRQTGRPLDNGGLTRGKLPHLRIGRLCHRESKTLPSAKGKTRRRVTIRKRCVRHNRNAPCTKRDEASPDQFEKGQSRPGRSASWLRAISRVGKPSRRQKCRDGFRHRGIQVGEMTKDIRDQTTRVTADIVYRIRKSSGRKARTGLRTSLTTREIVKFCSGRTELRWG